MISWLLAGSLALAAPKPEPLVLNTSFVAQGIRPGFKVGLDYPLLEHKVTRKRAPKGRRTVRRALVVEPALTAWHHPNNMTPVTAGGQLIYRRALGNGRHRELFVGQGATYAFNANPTYELSASGKLEKVPLAGHWMSATSMGFGLGRDLSRAGGPDLAWHLRPTLTIWAPYSTGAAPVFTVEVGVRKAHGRKR